MLQIDSIKKEILDSARSRAQHKQAYVVHSRADVAIRAAGDVHQVRVSHINLENFCFHFDLVETARSVHLRLNSGRTHGCGSSEGL